MKLAPLVPGYPNHIACNMQCQEIVIFVDNFSNNIIKVCYLMRIFPKNRLNYLCNLCITTIILTRQNLQLIWIKFTTWIGAGRSANISFLAPLVYPFIFTRIWIPSWYIRSAALPLHGTAERSMKCSASAKTFWRKAVPSSGERE